MVKNENGSITLYVLLTCLFFIFILSMVYVSNLNKMQVQEQEVKQIQENYKRQISRAEEIYEIYKEQASEIITISFMPNGNEEWAKMHSTQVIVNTSEENKANIKQIKYVWSNSEIEPDFTNAQTIQNKETVTKSSETGEYYLHVQVEDNAGNITTARSNVFYIDNTPPVITAYQTNTTAKEYTKTINTDTSHVTDAHSGVIVKKYATGSQTVSYFSSNGTTLGNSFIASYQTYYNTILHQDLRNQLQYTIYAKDAAGNESVKTITTQNVYILYTATGESGLCARSDHNSRYENGNIVMSVTPTLPELSPFSPQYGPYCILPAGSFDVEFYGTNFNSNNIYFDVCTDGSSTILAEFPKSDISTYKKINFSLPGPCGNIEYRTLLVKNGQTETATVTSAKITQLLQ